LCGSYASSPDDHHPRVPRANTTRGRNARSAGSSSTAPALLWPSVLLAAASGSGAPLRPRLPRGGPARFRPASACRGSACETRGRGHQRWNVPRWIDGYASAERRISQSSESPQLVQDVATWGESSRPGCSRSTATPASR
jgi:hypothetical protein